MYLIEFFESIIITIKYIVPPRIHKKYTSLLLNRVQIL